MFAIVKTFFLFDCNLSPRGDGNSSGIRVLVLAYTHCNLSPRGDGKPRSTGISVLRSYCNLSPQGDGNILLLTWKENRSIIDLSL